MPLHARPIPAPANVPGGRNDPARPQVRLTSPLDDPPATAAVPAAAPAAPASPTSDVETPPYAAAPEAAQQLVTATSTPGATPWPWYRREPWVPVILAAFVPLGVGFVLPHAFHLLLIGVSALLVVLSTAMLIRQGPFTEHPRPALPHDAVRRPKERRSVAA